jgi:hypothetical protein
MTSLLTWVDTTLFAVSGRGGRDCGVARRQGVRGGREECERAAHSPRRAATDALAETIQHGSALRSSPLTDRHV